MALVGADSHEPTVGVAPSTTARWPPVRAATSRPQGHRLQGLMKRLPSFTLTTEAHQHAQHPESLSGQDFQEPDGDWRGCGITF